LRFREISIEQISNILSNTHPNFPQSLGFFRDGRMAYPEDTITLFYSHEEDILEVWSIGKDGLLAYHARHISEAEVFRYIDSLHHSLNIYNPQFQRSPRNLDISTGSRGLAPIPRAYSERLLRQDAVRDLTELLIPEPIADSIHDAQHLIVVPALNVGTVPYAILEPYGDDSQVVDRTSVSIAPSLFDLNSDVRPWYTTDVFASPLIIGDPYLPDHPNWYLPSLPGAEAEAIAVAERLNTNALTARQAQKDTVIRRAPRSSLLYFAAHGISNPINPLSGGFLMLSGPTLQSGWWTAAEIQQTNLRDAQLAVLSACQTGLGGVHDAGIIGVARAFQLAGVRRVVMSLWNVNDDSTRVLMEAFIEHLHYELPHEALRLAMLDTREIYPSPVDWASFTFFGTPR
jgi:CHAT domain-containing protein